MWKSIALICVFQNAGKTVKVKRQRPLKCRIYTDHAENSEGGVSQNDNQQAEAQHPGRFPHQRQAGGSERKEQRTLVNSLNT